MSESGCQRDVSCQNLEVSGTSIIGSNSAKTIVDSHLVSFGSRKVQTFAGSLAGTEAGVLYANGDCLVELGTLDTSLPSGFTAATRFYIHKAIVFIKTPAGTAVSGNLTLSAATGTLTNAAVTGTEIVGEGVIAFSSLDSAAVPAAGAATLGPNADEIDIDLNGAANSYHVFAPNVVADINNTHLYLIATTGLNADATAGRYTVELEYSVL